MFWERYNSLCLEKGVKPNSKEARSAFGIPSTGTISSWAKGHIPERPRLEVIAGYFGVTVGYLLGHTDVRSPAPSDKEKPPAEAEGEGLLAEALSRARRLNEANQRVLLALVDSLIEQQEQ